MRGGEEDSPGAQAHGEGLSAQQRLELRVNGVDCCVDCCVQRAEIALRSLRTAVEDAGVTVHDVVIVGDDDAPVMALKGLRLKGMAPVSNEDAFTLDR